MARRPKRPCARPGCPTLVDRGYCAEHERQRQRTYDRSRGKTAERGYGAQHRKWRAMVLARDPVCVDPYGVHAERGEVVASTVADHIVPIRRGGARFDLANGQGLCASCHGVKTAREDGGFGRGAGQQGDRGGEKLRIPAP